MRQECHSSQIVRDTTSEKGMRLIGVPQTVPQSREERVCANIKTGRNTGQDPISRLCHEGRDPLRRQWSKAQETPAARLNPRSIMAVDASPNLVGEEEEHLFQE